MVILSSNDLSSIEFDKSKIRVNSIITDNKLSKNEDVAELVCAMAGKPFTNTTGSQVKIDG